RRELVDHDHRVGVVGADEVARVHAERTGAPGDRRGDLRVLEVQLRVVDRRAIGLRSEEHTSELQSLTNLVCRLLLEKKKKVSPKYAGYMDAVQTSMRFVRRAGASQMPRIRACGAGWTRYKPGASRALILDRCWVHIRRRDSTVPVDSGRLSESSSRSKQNIVRIDPLARPSNHCGSTIVPSPQLYSAPYRRPSRFFFFMTASPPACDVFPSHSPLHF